MRCGNSSRTDVPWTSGRSNLKLSSAVAAWSVTIIAFCLGLFIGAENSPKGRFKVPFLLGHHYRHLIHHAYR